MLVVPKLHMHIIATLLKSHIETLPKQDMHRMNLESTWAFFASATKDTTVKENAHGNDSARDL